MEKQYNTIVYIGRFQPPTNAHYDIIKLALKLAQKVIVIVGSAKLARSFRNPFTETERIEMLSAMMGNTNNKRISYHWLTNSNYNFNWWLKEVQNIVNSQTTPTDKIGLIGYEKDTGGYYLKSFPQWDSIRIGKQRNGLSATEIRDKFFSNNEELEYKEGIQPAVYMWLQKWLHTNFGDWYEICNEKMFIDNYKAQWLTAPYPLTFVTTDSIVLCKGHILLIKRHCNPGKGLYAMPGGFLAQDEHIVDGAVRELKEETRIDVDKHTLKQSISFSKVFDDPYRDARGRTITHCYLYNLQMADLPQVKGGDDAYSAKWIDLATIDVLQGQFFGDHYMIIKNMLGQTD